MTRYADAGRCPDCTAPITPDVTSCPTCALPLRGTVARELYVTLQRADQLLVTLRSSVSASVAPTVAAPLAVPAAAAGAPAGPSLTPAPRRRALSGASVPQLLLGLGALCLLVAALVFLAVTWSVMGVGGRTATLVALTAVAGGVTALVARRGLRGATESLGLVSLGLVALDVTGADNAGWFGDLGPSAFLVLLGAVLAAAATAACLAVRSTPARSFTAGELVTGLAWCFIVGGTDLGRDVPSAGAAVLATVLAAAAAAALHRLSLRVAATAVGTVTALAWLWLVAVGLERVSEQLTVAHVWGELAAWPLVVAGLLLVVPAVVPAPLLRPVALVREAGLSVGTALLVLVVLSPTLDNGATPATLAVLTALAVSLAGLWVLPPRWSAAAVLTALAGTAVAVAESIVLTGQAWTRVEAALTVRGSFGDRFPTAPVEDLQPWLLLLDAGLAVAAVLVARHLLTGDLTGDPTAKPAEDLSLQLPVRSGLMLVGLAAAAATAVLYPVPVWAVVAGLLAAGVAFLVLDDLLVAVPAAAAGVALATYADGLTAFALGVVLVAAAGVHVRDRRVPVVRVAAAVAVTSLGASVWVWGDLLDHPGTWTAAVGLVVVAAVLLLRRDPGVEVGAAVAAVGLSFAGLGAAPYELTATWAAVYLTLAGAAVATLALLREDRRAMGWVGGFLLAAASWVRLADVGVHQPEPYTLPSALVLLGLGALQLRRRPEEDTLRLLGPGLGLALTPSLLWVLEDPTTLRALLLGLACLGLVLVGLQLRWTAPLLFGVAVGAAVVLRCAAPYVGDAVPRWATIGTAGVLLLVLGTTWEARVREARLLLGYVRQLR